MDDWEFTLPALAGRARAIALDMPGFGRAIVRADFDFSPEGSARHLGGVLAQLGVTGALPRGLPALYAHAPALGHWPFIDEPAAE